MSILWIQLLFFCCKGVLLLAVLLLYIFGKKSLPGFDDYKAAFCLSSLSKSEFNIFPFCGHPSACVLISRVITVYCIYGEACALLIITLHHVPVNVKKGVIRIMTGNS